ncbi:MAG TPA: cell division protein FtsK, partial [Actinomycetes bacterium]
SRLVREGAAVGIRVVLTGDRAALTSRVGAMFRDRIVLRLADPADYALAGIGPRQVPSHLPPGRALVGADTTEGQLGLLAGDPRGAGQVAALARIAEAARRRHSHRVSGGGPMRVEPLPSSLDAEAVETDAKAFATGPGWVLLGVGGDELDPVGVDLLAHGPALVVAGPPGSGRSTTLAAVGRWQRHQGRPVAVVAHRRSPLHRLAGEPGVLACLGPADAAQLAELLAARPDLTVLADDAETLHDTPVEQPLLGMLRPDAEGASLVLAGSASDMAGCFRGLTVEARRGRTGVLLGQVAAVDGDLFGVRLPRTPPGPVGRGVLVVRGRATPLQVARTAL